MAEGCPTPLSKIHLGVEAFYPRHSLTAAYCTSPSPTDEETRLDSSCISSRLSHSTAGHSALGSGAGDDAASSVSDSPTVRQLQQPWHCSTLQYFCLNHFTWAMPNLVNFVYLMLHYIALLVQVFLSYATDAKQIILRVVKGQHCSRRLLLYYDEQRDPALYEGSHQQLLNSLLRRLVSRLRHAVVCTSKFLPLKVSEWAPNYGPPMVFAWPAEQALFYFYRLRYFGQTRLLSLYTICNFSTLQQLAHKKASFCRSLLQNKAVAVLPLWVIQSWLFIAEKVWISDKGVSPQARGFFSEQLAQHFSHNNPATSDVHSTTEMPSPIVHIRQRIASKTQDVTNDDHPGCAMKRNVFQHSQHAVSFQRFLSFSFLVSPQGPEKSRRVIQRLLSKLHSVMNRLLENTSPECRLFINYTCDVILEHLAPWASYCTTFADRWLMRLRTMRSYAVCGIRRRDPKDDILLGVFKYSCQ